MHGSALRGFALLATARSLAQAISYDDGAPMRLASTGRSERASVGVTADGMTYDLRPKNDDSYDYSYDYNYDYSYSSNTVDDGLGSAKDSVITIASSNMMGYYTWPKCGQDRLRNICAGIKNSNATILGVQEHPLWNTKGGAQDLIQNDNEATNFIAENTGLKHSKFGVYYDPKILEVVGTPEKHLICHYWESKWNEDRYISCTVFLIKGTNSKFTYCNNHWDHTAQREHKDRAIEFMKQESWPSPKFLTGDFNNWNAYEDGEVGWLMKEMSPPMKDALPANEKTWYDNCCKIDYILYTENSGAEVKSSKVDRDGAGGEGCWSGARADHALVYAQFRLTT